MLDKQRSRAELERKWHDAELAQVEVEARLKMLQRELEARRAELASLEQAREEQEEAWRQHTANLVRHRAGADRLAGGSDGE